MIADSKPYPAYRDSGIPWLGDVPEHWEARKLRQVLRPVTERNRPDLPLLSVVRERGVILRNVEDRDENHNFVPDDLTNYKVVRTGQFAMNKMKAWQGSYGVSRFDGLVSPAYFVFDLLGADGDFFHAAIRSRAYVPFFTQASDGVRIGQWDLSQDRMKEIPFFLPPPEEQAAIVRYLDHADRRIRRYIRAKQRLIALLEEQKQAIIHQAVTRGLDPTVPMKPSGVEWLGDIPGHWEVRRVKAVLREVDRRSVDGREVLLSLRMRQGLVPHNDVSSVPISESSLVGFKRVEPGQIVMNRMRAAIGLFGVPGQSGLVSPDYAVFEPRADLCLGFLLRLFKTPQMCGVFRTASKGLGTGSSGFMRLYTDQFGAITVPFPPADEQHAIARRIDRELGEASCTQERIEAEIDLLREYRTRLIADVVTGKLDVREAAARLPDAEEEQEPLDELDDVEAEELEAELEEAVT